MSTKNETKPRSGPKTWKPGQSGNPGGRSPRVGPNGETVAELARAHTKDAIDCLVEVLTGKGNEPRDRIAAANALLDRGWGKPKESVDLDARVEGTAVPVIQFVRQPDTEQP